jgi:hypothetical protein
MPAKAGIQEFLPVVPAARWIFSYPAGMVLFQSAVYTALGVSCTQLDPW